MGPLLGGILMAGSSLLGAGAARSAANAQADAAEDQLELQREMFDWQTEQTAPWRESGKSAQPYLNFLAGIGPAPMVGGQAPQIETITAPGTAGQPAQEGSPWTIGRGNGNQQFSARRGGLRSPTFNNRKALKQWMRQQDALIGEARGGTAPSTQYRVGGQTFGTMDEAQEWANANRQGGEAWNPTLSPLAQFRMREGTDAIEGGAAGRGNLFSGNALKRLETMRSGEALADVERLYGKIAGISGQGLQATGMGANAAQNFAQGGSNALANFGDARAAGSMGMANALQGGLNNWMAYNTFNKMMA